MIRRPILRPIVFFNVLLLGLASTWAQPTPEMTLDEAVAALRLIDRSKLTEAQMEEKSTQIDKAWKVLTASGQTGLARLNKEVQRVDTAKEKDDFFKLNASVLFWRIGKMSEAESIAAIWNSTPPSVQYNYVFHTAMEAARTQDPAVLPMLRAVLKDDKGAVFFSMHAMNVGWPLSHEFVWGAYGPNGLPILHKILETSTDPVELRSAMRLLAQTQYLPSLPLIRKLASSTQDDVRRQAIQSLGVYGHPIDYDFLIAGLRSTDTKELFAYAFALYEFDDLRAASHLIPLLNIDDEGLKVEVFLGLLHLLTPESFQAAKTETAKVKNAEQKEFMDTRVQIIQQELPADYAKKSAADRMTAIASIRNADLALEPGGRRLTVQQLLEAAKEWKANNRIYKGKYDWVQSVHLIDAAKAENIDLLLDAKAAFYTLLSDECLYEVRLIDKAVKYIGRSRYRKGLGIVERAEVK